MIRFLQMRLIALLLVVIGVSASAATAHEVSGAVEVILKGDKRKSDLSSIVVYLSQAGAGGRIPGSILRRNFTIETRNKKLIPDVLPVPVGATVHFPNYDPIFHNLFSVSAPHQFDFGLYKGGASKSKTFGSPGIVKVFCNVHPQMAATIVVSDTQFFTSTDKNGNFALGYVPNGNYEVVAYADEGLASQKIQVGDKSLRLQITIDGRKFKRVRHKNKFGKDYETDEKY